MMDYFFWSDQDLKSELSELAENCITSGDEVNAMKAELERRYPIE